MFLKIALLMSSFFGRRNLCPGGRRKDLHQASSIASEAGRETMQSITAHYSLLDWLVSFRGVSTLEWQCPWRPARSLFLQPCWRWRHSAFLVMGRRSRK